MTSAREQRVAELVASRRRIDQQIRRILGESAPPRIDLTPAQIHARAEQTRQAAVRRYHDDPHTIAARRHLLLADSAALRWHDYRHPKRHAA